MADPTPAEPKKGEDKRLDRIQTYTNFHIGLYAALFAAVIGYLKPTEQTPVEVRVLLAISCGLLLLAGAAGGIIAANVTTAESYEKFMKQSLAPRKWKELPEEGAPKAKLTYERVSLVEHSAFWAGVGFLILTLVASVYHPTPAPTTAVQVTVTAPPR